MDFENFATDFIDCSVFSVPVTSNKLYKNEFPQSEQNCFTALFNNMHTLKFKALLTKLFFTTIIQMFGNSSQLLTIAEHVVIKSLSTIQTTKQCTAEVGI